MKINAVLRCKEPEIKPRAYEVSDVITLSDAEYRSVLKEPLKDREYLAGRQGADTCVLLIGENSDDGILVDTRRMHAVFNRYVYAHRAGRHSAFQ